jgi:hypothetical protein
VSCRIRHFKSSKRWKMKIREEKRKGEERMKVDGGKNERGKDER